MPFELHHGRACAPALELEALRRFMEELSADLRDVIDTHFPN
jgi:hypothetical protein